jgi:6-pyruvoyl tetrahydropterin synthase/QueD family protein
VLAPRKRPFPTGRAPFALDSGAYSHLARNGRWKVSAEEYARRVRQIAEGTGTMEWAATQDWLCSPDTLEATGKTVLEHQELTIQSWLELNELEPEIAWLPTLQGWELDDYLRHIEMYEGAGVDLLKQPLVGLGSIARRQSDDEVIEMLGEFSALGLRLHGFGVKISGLRRALPYLASSDSMAWSWEGRMRVDDPRARHSQTYAEGYRRRVLEMVAETEAYVAYEGIFEHFPVREDEMNDTNEVAAKPTSDGEYEVTTTVQWDMAHRIPLHSSKCRDLHGHRYVAEVTCRARTLTREGFVVDFGLLKRVVGGWIDENWDHNTCYWEQDSLMKMMSELHVKDGGRPWFKMREPPTAECLARHLYWMASSSKELEHFELVDVVVWETPTSRARFSSLRSRPKEKGSPRPRPRTPNPYDLEAVHRRLRKARE